MPVTLTSSMPDKESCAVILASSLLLVDAGTSREIIGDDAKNGADDRWRLVENPDGDELGECGDTSRPLSKDSADAQ